MGLGNRFRAGLARQLGRPEGLRGRMVARGLNRGNHAVIAAAIEASGVRAGQVAADVGFGGGVGLELLLDRVAPAGRVHGVELSDTMMAAARRRHPGELARGTLSLAKGTLQQLPLEDGLVDGLITVNTIYFVDDLPAAFAEIARVLAGDGRAVIGAADPEWMATQPITEHVFRLRPIAELIGGLEAAGLAVHDEQLADDRRRFHLLVATPKAG